MNKDKFLQAISTNMWKRRNENSLSVVDLADATGIGWGTIRNYESGQVMPTILNLIKIADFYEISIEELLWGEVDV